MSFLVREILSCCFCSSRRNNKGRSIPLIGDINVTSSAEDMNDLCNDLQAEVDTAAEWLLQKRPSLNTDKTHYMVVGHK